MKKQKVTGYDWDKAREYNRKKNQPNGTPRGSVNGNA